MQHVVAANLLLGDGLMATPAVAALRDKVAPAPVEVVLFDPHRSAADGPPQHWAVWDHFPGVAVRHAFGADAAPYVQPFRAGRWWVVGGQKEITLDSSAAFTAASGKCHMAYGFAQQVGVGIDLRYVFEGHPGDMPPDERLPDISFEFAVVLCPVSTSCGSRSGRPANNMVPWLAWERLAARLVAADLHPVVAARGEADPGWPGTTWLADWSIREVAWLLEVSRAVVTVDTGLAHLACAVGAHIAWVRGGRFRSETSVGHTRGQFAAVDKPVGDVTDADLYAALGRVIRLE